MKILRLAAQYFQRNDHILWDHIPDKRDIGLESLSHHLYDPHGHESAKLRLSGLDDWIDIPTLAELLLDRSRLNPDFFDKAKYNYLIELLKQSLSFCSPAFH